MRKTPHQYPQYHMLWTTRPGQVSLSKSSAKRLLIVPQWHIFYIDKDNYIRERIADNTTNQWREGPLRELGLKAMDHANVGLQACWYGSFYGTANVRADESTEIELESRLTCITL